MVVGHLKCCRQYTSHLIPRSNMFCSLLEVLLLFQVFSLAYLGHICISFSGLDHFLLNVWNTKMQKTNSSEQNPFVVWNFVTKEIAISFVSDRSMCLWDLDQSYLQADAKSCWELRRKIMGNANSVKLQKLQFLWSYRKGKFCEITEKKKSVKLQKRKILLNYRKGKFCKITQKEISVKLQKMQITWNYRKWKLCEITEYANYGKCKFWRPACVVTPPGLSDKEAIVVWEMVITKTL